MVLRDELEDHQVVLRVMINMHVSPWQHLIQGAGIYNSQ